MWENFDSEWFIEHPNLIFLNWGLIFYFFPLKYTIGKRPREKTKVCVEVVILNSKNMPMGGGQGVWIPNSYKATKNGPWNTPPPPPPTPEKKILICIWRWCLLNYILKGLWKNLISFSLGFFFHSFVYLIKISFCKLFMFYRVISLIYTATYYYV